MSCTRTRGVRNGIAWQVAGALLGASLAASTSSAQQAGTPVPAPPLYHAPVLVLAQPGDGGGLPADKPLVVFRFVQGELTDPVDALSFVVTVDGTDRTSRFQMANGEAWGMIDDPSAAITSAHDLRARICSARGACATVHGSVNTVPVDIASGQNHVTPAASKSAPKQKARAAIQVLDKVLQAARVLSHP